MIMIGESYLTKLTKDKTKLPGANFGLDQLRFVKKVVYGSLDVLRNVVKPNQSDQSDKPKAVENHPMEMVWNKLREDTANNVVPTNSKLSKTSKSLPTNNIQPFGNNSKQPAIAQQANQNIQSSLAQQRRDTQRQQDQAQNLLRQQIKSRESF